MAEKRLTLGVAARLSRYLQILTQTRKSGRSTISSRVLSEYANVNPTQIRRDLSAFGKFGKRGVGYDVDYLITRIKDILHTAGQHNIALLGCGNLGTAIASSDVFVDHGFRIEAVFDLDPARIGQRIGGLTVQHPSEIPETVAERDIIVGVLAVPASAASSAAKSLIDSGVRIIFNYSEALLDAPPGVTVHSMSPAGELLYALYFYLS
ncbi:MAG: redox-sensing transcriptional repressor Rex [Thermoleophilia bacterium]|nr:redox-sensing transcriptional repressor Rex [Thermoleophilia bacterium]